LTTRRAPGLFFILATMLLDILGIGIAIPITPQLVAGFTGGDLSAAAVHVGTMSAIYTAMMFLCSPLLGALSDRFGRKPVLLGALAASTAGYAAMALAPTLGVLLASRALAGLGGASLTVAQTYIADVSSHEDRAKNYGLSGAAFGLGFIIGPAIGGWLGSWGVTAPFWAAAAVTFANLLYGAFAVPESLDPAHRRAFRWAEANPLGWLVTLREHPVVLSFAAALVWVWLGNQALQSTWVIFTTYRFGWTPADNGYSLAAVGLSAAFVQGFLIRWLLPRLGERRAVLMGLWLSALGQLAYGLATQGWMLYAILVATSVAGVCGPALQALISRQVGPSQQGAVQGAMTSLMSLTGIFGPLVANNLFARFTAAGAPVKLPGVAFFMGALCFVIGAICATRLFRRLPAEPAAPIEQAA
jgi:DHA1 family tetracycline resistance protein-like MFS transporter